jgi:hypothetical protein
MNNHFRFVVVTAFVAGLASPAAAQMGERTLELGIKGGPTFSTVSVEDDEGADFGNLTAFGIGAFLRIPAGAVAFQPELLYVGKGSKVTEADFGGNVDLKIKLSYIEIPLLIQVPIGAGQGATPYIFGGASLAFETGCTFSAEGDGVSLDIDCDEGDEEDLEFQRKKFDYGAVIGAGLRLPAGSGAFLVEGRYTLGLADLNDLNEDNSIKNRSAAVYVGYSLAIGN